MLRLKYIKLFFFFLIPIIIGTILFCCKNKDNKSSLDDELIIDLQQIKERGKLIAITDYNSTDYFVYKGEPMGFQFELLKLLAEHLGIKLEVIVSNDLGKTFEFLNNNECDLIAIDLTITKTRSKIVNFTEPYSTTRQVLVQRKPDGWKKMRYSEIENHLIRNQLDLAGKTIYVQKGSSFYPRLKNLSDEIGDSIHIIEVQEYETEQLITLVAKGEIDYTVSDEHVALVNKTYYPNIDVKTPISFPQNLAWAVRKNSNELLADINQWLKNYKKTKHFRIIYNKYFKNPRSVNIVQSEFFSISSGKVSLYDDDIKLHSKKIDWDWRLLASLIYQESRFKPYAKSWAGAYGLMQLMPNTAKMYGIDSLSSTSANIAAGAKYIYWIDKQFDGAIEDKQERIKFVLASYNVGLGHILDARRLASKNSKDPDIWAKNVDYYLLNKSNPKYYRDSVVKFGYCRGEEPYNYVQEILERYEHYKNVIKD